MSLSYTIYSLLPVLTDACMETSHNIYICSHLRHLLTIVTVNSSVYHWFHITWLQPNCYVFVFSLSLVASYGFSDGDMPQRSC